MSELGLLLLVVGAALAVLEAHVPTHGALGGTAVAATAGGLALLVAGAGSGPAVAVAVALAAALVGGGYLWVVLHKALAARRARVRSGAEGLIGRVGEGGGAAAAAAGGPPPPRRRWACSPRRARWGPPASGASRRTRGPCSSV